MSYERDFFKILDGVITNMREIIPTAIKMQTFIPLSADQTLNIVENTIMITLDSAKISYQCSTEWIKRRYSIKFSAKFHSLKSQKDAIAWAYNVLENICIYLVLPNNRVAQYLETNGLTYFEPGEIFSEPAPNGTSAEAEFSMDLFGDAKIGSGVPLNTIYKSLYDDVQGLCDTYTITDGD